MFLIPIEFQDLSVVANQNPYKSKPIGRAAYAAMAAVEGLRLSKASEARLVAMRRAKLTPEECRAAVIRAYSKNLEA